MSCRSDGYPSGVETSSALAAPDLESTGHGRRTSPRPSLAVGGEDHARLGGLVLLLTGLTAEATGEEVRVGEERHGLDRVSGRPRERACEDEDARAAKRQRHGRASAGQREPCLGVEL